MRLSEPFLVPVTRTENRMALGIRVLKGQKPLPDIVYYVVPFYFIWVLDIISYHIISQRGRQIPRQEVALEIIMFMFM